MSEKEKYDALVVGSGPNGLAAAITLAQKDFSVLLIEAKDQVGGGMRSASLTLPGFAHDICAAVHPMGVVSPFFQSLDLKSHGLEWIYPSASLAHPFDNGTAVILERSVDETAELLGADRERYRKLMKPLVNNWDYLIKEILQPLHVPERPMMLARFGLKARYSIEGLIKQHFENREARALMAGILAHAIMPTGQAGGAAFGLVLAAAGHTVGWPIAKGGSQSIADSLRDKLISLGGEVRTGEEVRSLNDLPPARANLFDVTPKQLAAVADNIFPETYLRHLKNYKYGPGIFKIDWALSSPIPWKAKECLRAATVHVGGSFAEIAESENAVWQNEHPENPFVILAQPGLFDSSRVPEGKQTGWAYCHVPNGSTRDMTDRIEKQIERFAPGFRDIILKRTTMNTAELEQYNPNYVGGDISGGAQGLFYRMMRPLGRWVPFSTPVKGLYLCSASMPPGAGVHGMCGYYAAKLALREVFR